MNILESIGNTPLVEIKVLNERRPDIKIFGKLEGSNPGGSVKDRAAYYMLRKGESSGKLKRGVTILEATSGNTGIALAMIGAAKGYKVKLIMPGSVSAERKQILEALGAEVELTPAEEGTDGAIYRSQELKRKFPDNYFVPNQFKNESNILAHYETTGPEILSQTMGEIDIFVAGMGTTGTLMGVGKFLKENKPGIKIVGVEPRLGHKIQGLKNMEEAIVPGIYTPNLLDMKVMVDDEEAFETSRMLAKKEGIFAGMSSGASVAGALKIAESVEAGTIVTVLPDRGDRYLSTDLFKR